MEALSDTQAVLVLRIPHGPGVTWHATGLSTAACFHAAFLQLSRQVPAAAGTAEAAERSRMFCAFILLASRLLPAHAGGEGEASKPSLAFLRRLYVGSSKSVSDRQSVANDSRMFAL